MRKLNRLNETFNFEVIFDDVNEFKKWKKKRKKSLSKSSSLIKVKRSHGKPFRWDPVSLSSL